MTGAAAVHGRPWRRLVASVLAESDLCWLCGHPGSQSGDHVIPRSIAPHLTLVRANVRPAHGVQGCPICRRRCNQSRGNGAARRDVNRRRVRTMLTEVALGIELAEDRGHAAVAAAGYGPERVVVVELAAYLDGTAGVVAAVAALTAARTVLATAVDPHSPGATLIKPLTAARIAVTAPTTSDVVIAHGLFLDKLAAGQLRHVSDPRLDAAVRYGVQRPLGGARAWERRGQPVDVAPLTAATLATWALENAPRFAPAEIF